MEMIGDSPGSGRTPPEPSPSTSAFVDLYSDLEIQMQYFDPTDEYTRIATRGLSPEGALRQRRRLQRDEALREFAVIRQHVKAALNRNRRILEAEDEEEAELKAQAAAEAELKAQAAAEATPSLDEILERFRDTTQELRRAQERPTPVADALSAYGDDVFARIRQYIEEGGEEGEEDELSTLWDEEDPAGSDGYSLHFDEVPPTPNNSLVERDAFHLAQSVTPDLTRNASSLPRSEGLYLWT